MSLASSLRRLAPLALAALASMACAEERPPINRVQPNALQKGFFVGSNLADPADDPEFYAAATVIDTPYGVDHGLFSGQAGGLKRLKWEILEDQLVARATYETYDGVDGHGSRRTNDGQVIAAFPIVSHFDIQREYNPSTGEELNIVGENTSDRPWYEREFVRVDWSRNLVTSSIWWDPLAQNVIFEGANYGVEPLAYYVNDPASPDAPRFAGNEGYFDVTQKVLVTPRTLTLDGQTFPTCLWRGAVVRSGKSETGVCGSSEIKVRMSFQRVKTPFDPGYREYEPKHWDGARMDAFGIFTQDRQGYDDHYGVVDDKWYRFAQRYNIWKASFVRDTAGNLLRCGATGPYDPALDPNRDLVGNNGEPGPDGTDDECQGGPAGSRCNTIVGACSMPYARREVGTVAWHHHMSNDDAIIVEQSKLATEEWDTALRLAVQAARQAECRATSGRSLAGTRFRPAYDQTQPGSTPGVACAAVFPIDQHEEAELKNVRALNRCWDQNGRGSAACIPVGVATVEPAVAFCNNPVKGPTFDANGNQIYAGDDPSCGPPGLVTRPGDIRYHSINIWKTPEDSSPWGFGPSWADPLTGEIIQSSINVYGAVTDERAQRIVDRVRWFKGELATSEILTAQYVRDRPRTDGRASEGVSQFLQPRAEVDRRLLGMRHVEAEALANAPALRSALEPIAGARALRADLEKSLMPPSLGGANAASFQARMDAVRGTPLEAQLVGPMWFDAASVNPQNAGGAGIDAASPLGPENARKRIALEEAVQRRLAQNGTCLYEADAPEPSSMPALGSLFDRKFPLDQDASAETKSQRVTAMWNYTRAKMHYGVLLHEMGHTIGLRHNFTSSFDKFNYRPQYWQLRTGDGAANARITTVCDDETTDPTGASCIGPRYYDPLTQDEIDNSIYTWAQTTVMDYSGDLTHDWLGLGIYDYAAARMFYGDVVDVREDFVCPASGCQNGSTAFSASDLVDFPGYLIPQTVDEGSGADFRVLHYSEWNNHFQLVDQSSCRVATEEEVTAPAGWDESRYGIWDPVFDGEVVHNEVCARPPVAYYSWRELEPDAATDFRYRSDPQYYAPRRARTVANENGQSFVRMPYSFASDEFRDGWSPSILTRDAGADQYEQAMFFINQYENGHLWTNFRNGRSNFSIVTSYMNEIERFHTKLGNFVQGLSLLHDYYSSEIAKNGRFTHAEVLAAYEGKGGFMREQAIAAGLVFDHFVRVLTRPQAGLHYTMPWSNGMFLADQDRIGAQPGNFAVQMTIPNGTTLLGQDLTFGGRPLDNGFEYGQGYWYYDYINQAGDFYEKAYAFDLMLDATYRAPYAFTRWDGIDGRWQFTNFTNLFPEGMRRLIGAMLTEDTDLYAPRVTGVNGRPDLLPADPVTGQRVPANPLGWASYVPEDGPEHCFPSGGNYLCRDSLSEPILTGTTPDTVAVEPQLGFEIQKFLAFWAYVYMPDSQVLDFVDMMRIWKMGEDIDPTIAGGYVEFVDPQTNIHYFARRQGDETLFGKTYDKGIAAKMLQWANALVAKAYVVDAATPPDPATGAVTIMRDTDGNPLIANDGFTLTTNTTRTCDDNRFCVQLRNYRGLIDFVRDMGHQVGFFEPELSTVER
jgi:hypothetical protein